MDPIPDQSTSSSSYCLPTTTKDSQSHLIAVRPKTEAQHGGHFWHNIIPNSNSSRHSTLEICIASDDESLSSSAFPIPSLEGSSSNLALEYDADSAASPLEMLFPQSSNKKLAKRSGDLVRVTGLSEDELLFTREVVRRTRMLFDALRIFISAHEEKFHKPEAESADATAHDPHHSMRRKRAKGHLLASKVMRLHNLWINRDKRVVGDVPGIEIGDVFFYRLELCVVGLHGQSQAGIDYLPGVRSSNGQPIATSIIVSGGYEDDEDSGNVLIYTGHGGQDKLAKQCMDQKLEGGNLALERSIHYKIEVRVIRGFKYEGSVSSKIYVYDGLYRITDYWFETGKSGFGVYKFKLYRVEGQPEMGSRMLTLAQKLRNRLTEVRPKGYISFDLSQRLESFPVLVYNDVDELRHPLKFGYLKKTVFPSFVNSNVSYEGCDCATCDASCYCAKRNGGEFAYDQNGFLLRGKPVVFECGPRCKCGNSCVNRVAQKGLRKRLEVYRSAETLWGVRSLDLIEAGSFVCEYTGVVVPNEQLGVDSSGRDIVYPGRFESNWADWGDLSKVDPGFCHYAMPPPLEFAMDVSRMRNVACYFSHSSFPNVFVQRVLYDHDDVAYPHLMVFALENIPPMRDLCLNYGSFEDPLDQWGEIKQENLAICY